jgi:hypothetical protein
VLNGRDLIGFVMLRVPQGKVASLRLSGELLADA